MTLVFYVRGQALSGFVPDVMVSDTINYQDAEVRFSEDWDGLDKWLHLKSPDGVEYEARLVGDRVEGLNLSAGRWEVWFHGSRPGEDGKDDFRITTDTTAFVVEQSGALDGEPLPPIELTAAEQIAAAVTRAETEVAGLREDVEQYRQDVEETANETRLAKAAAEAAAVGAFGSQAAADQSAQAAQVSEQNAEKARQAIENMEVRAVTLDTGADSTVTKEMVGDAVRLIFGIARGERGPAGVSIEKIERTSGTGAPGETDTYTVYLSNGETFSFSVYNGKDGENGNGGPGTGSGDFMANGSVAMTGVLQMGGNRISGVGEPSGDNDAVRKVDLAGKADLVSGKVPTEQLPDMDYAPASHALDTANPHGVTAAQVEAVPYLPVYYKDGMSADDLLVPFALIPSNSSNNAELNAIVGGTYAYVHTNFYGSASVTSRRQQIAMSYNSTTPKMAYRIYGANGWLPWKAVATEDYAVAVGFYDGDLDLLTADGHYRLGGNVTNGPSGVQYTWCQIIVIHGANTDTHAQILVDNTGRIHSRMYWGGEWKEWISSVSNAGDTMAGGLNFHPVGVTGYTQMYKNATSDSADYGTLMIDRDSTGKMIGLKLYAAAQKAIIFDSTSEYDLYHAGNKPTPADIGAAAASHNHSAANITSGTLAVTRGGTGVTSMTGASGLAHALFPTSITSYSGYSFPLLGNSWNNNGYINIGNMCAAIGAAKMQTGTYTGTGESSALGATYKNTLTFSFAPKLVVIFATNASTTAFFYAGASTYILGSESRNFLFVDAFGKTMTWHYGGNTTGGSLQLNTSGEVYTYVAIG